MVRRMTNRRFAEKFTPTDRMGLIMKKKKKIRNAILQKIIELTTVGRVNQKRLGFGSAKKEEKKKKNEEDEEAKRM